MTSSKCHLGCIMYKNKSADGKNNLCGSNIRKIRIGLVPKTSQRELADKLQMQGLDIDKNAIQRIESGARFVTDIELRAFAKVLNVSCDELIDLI
jgi:transcriptional regulator with XRE-family HTH domain